MKKEDLFGYIVGGVTVFWLTDGIINYYSGKTRQTRVRDTVEQTMPSVNEREDITISSRSLTEENSGEDESLASSPLHSLDGSWDLAITTDSRVHDSNKAEDLDATIHRILSLRTSGNSVEGELITSISDDIGGLCDQGSIEGKVDGEDVQLTLTFTGKDCCYLEKTSYTLRFADQIT